MTGKSSEAAFLSEWQPTASGNAVLALSMRWMGHVPALQMDFDFKGGGGFVVARRVLRRAMPNEYAVQFRLRGNGAINDLELKLVDDSGQNVWRYKKEGLRLPRHWTRMRVESRDIDFAWGPASGTGISRLGSLEFAIVAREGGKGTLWIAGVEIEILERSQGSLLRAQYRILSRRGCWPAPRGNRNPTIRDRGS
jgi:hypothetical protein